MVTPHDRIRPNTPPPIPIPAAKETSFLGRIWSSTKKFPSQITHFFNKHIFHKPSEKKEAKKHKSHTHPKKWAVVNPNIPARDDIPSPDEQVVRKMNQVLFFIKRQSPENIGTKKRTIVKSIKKETNPPLPPPSETHRTRDRGTAIVPPPPHRPLPITTATLEKVKIIKDLEPYTEETVELSGLVKLQGIKTEKIAKGSNSLLAPVLKVLQERYPRQFHNYTEENLQRDGIHFAKQNLDKEPFKTELNRLIEKEMEIHNSKTDGVETIKKEFLIKKQNVDREFEQRVNDIRQRGFEPKELKSFIRTLEFSKNLTVKKLEEEERSAINAFRAASNIIRTPQEYLERALKENIVTDNLYLYCLSYAYGIQIDLYDSPTLKKNANSDKRFEDLVIRYNPQSEHDPINLLRSKENQYQIISNYDPTAASPKEALIAALQEPIPASSNLLQELPSSDKHDDIFYGLALGLKKDYEEDIEIQEALNWDIQPDETHKLSESLKHEIAFLRNPGQHLKNQILDHLRNILTENNRTNPLLKDILNDIQNYNKENALAVNEAQDKLDQMEEDPNISQNLLNRQRSLVRNLERKKINSPFNYLLMVKEGMIRANEETLLKIFGQIYKVPVLLWKPWYPSPDLSEMRFNQERAPSIGGKKIKVKKIKGQSYMPVLIGQEFNNPPLQLVVNNRKAFQFINNAS